MTDGRWAWLPTVALVLACGQPTTQPREPEPHVEKATKAEKSERKLLWADEFDGPTIDASSWAPKVMRDPHNEELQFYTDRIDGTEGANAFIENGALVIEARSEAYEHRKYTSSRMTTKGKREFRYGRVEARIKQPAQVGLWPAFWMLGGNIDEVGWPRCGEIDIMEGKGRVADWTSGAIHRGPEPAKNQITPGEYELATGSFHDDWHVFAVEWEPGKIRWFVDGQLFHSVEKDPKQEAAYWPFDDGHSFYIILNLAVGGWFDKPNFPPADMKPKRLLVDYVRVYGPA